MTRIAVAIPVVRSDGISRALDLAREAKGHGADLVEWRLDSLVETEGGIRAAVRLIEESPLPCIVTVRDESEGGAFGGGHETRLAAWHAFASASPPPAYIDIELAAMHEGESSRAFVASLHRGSVAHEGRARAILSFHDFRGRPPGLSGKVSEIWADQSVAVAKVVWTARTARDNMEAFELLRLRAKPTIALCMGEHGLMSRVLAPKFGGFLTYARSDEHGTAPGQPTLHELLEDWDFRTITRSTKVYAVIGYPVAHSRSPAVHNTWFRKAKFDGRMFPVAVAPMWEAFKATLGELIACEGLDFSGAAVTAPHKVHALDYLAEVGGKVDDDAAALGAVNTIVRGTDGSLRGMNTDAGAIVEVIEGALASSTKKRLKGARVLVLGAGGAARAAVYGLAKAGAMVSILNRTPKHAKQLAKDLAGDLGEIAVVSPGHLPKEKFDVIANCTSVGMTAGPDPEGDPLPEGVALDGSTLVFDAVYAPEETPLLARAKRCGAPTLGGAAMFLAQARAQFRAWTGSAPLP